MNHNRSGSDKLKDFLRGAQKKSIQTGWFENSKYTPDKERNRKGGEYVAAVAYWLNKGSENMPARPFFSEAVADHSYIKALIKAAMLQVAQGNMTMDVALGQVGLAIEAKIIENIKSQKYAGLSEDYEEWKRKFHKSPQILIDTGQLWQQVTSRVIDNADAGR